MEHSTDSSLLSEGTLFMSNSTEHSPSSEANSSAFSWDSPCILQNLTAYFHVNKTLPLAKLETAEYSQCPPILLSCCPLNIIHSFIYSCSKCLLQVSPPEPCMHFCSLLYVPHDCLSYPLSFYHSC